MSETKKSTLAYIQEMFKDKVEEDVIKLVFTESQYNVEKTVMQLLTISESNSSKTNVGASSSRRKFDDIDPVDTPLPDMQRYLTPDTKDLPTEQLDLSTFLPQTQYPDPLPTTKPISLGTNPAFGTARPMVPNYVAIGNESLFASQKISPTEPKVQSGIKLSDGFNENETYVSDDDIDAIDIIDSINTSNKNDKVNQNQQSFVNSKPFKVNNPQQQKQMNKPNGNRTTSPHPFAPQLNFPQNQISYFANQARYFPSFVSSAFPHPFIPSRGNMPPGQYHRPSPQPGFRHPVPRHPIPHHPFPPRSITPGNKGANNFLQTDSMTYGNKAPNHSLPMGANQSKPMTDGFKAPNYSLPNHSMSYGNMRASQSTPMTVTTDGFKGSNNPTLTTFMTNGFSGPNHPAQATTHGSKRSNHPVPNTSTHGNKRPNLLAPTTTSMAYGNKGSNHSVPATTVTHGNKGSNHPIPNTPTHGNKGPIYPTPTTTSMTYGTKGSNPVQATTIAHGNKGPNHPRSITPTHGSRGPNHLTPTTNSMTHDNRASSHSSSTTCVSNKGSNNMPRGYSNSQTRMQAKFPSHEKKSLIILRGLPGSGKSTLARQLSARLGGMIISTDDYFTTKWNRYCFNPIELTPAHEWNQNRAKTFMEAGLTPLIIDNTNTQSWEMRPYVLIGLKCGYEVDIIEPETWWKWDIKELERRNTHGVTSKALEIMLERYEKNVTVDRIAKSAPKPIITPKSDGREDNGNAVKHETDSKHECTSNGNKLINESEKLSQADGKSGLGKGQRKPCQTETRRPATTKKTISLSANFSAPRDRKRSFGGNTSTKQGDKQEEKSFKNNTVGKGLDTTGNAADVSENSESNLDAAVTSKGEQSIPVALVSSIDAPINEQETSEEKRVPQVDKCIENKLNAPLNDQPGVTLDDQTRLNHVPHKDDGSKSESSLDGVPSCKASLPDDNQLLSKDTSDSLSSNLDEVTNECEEARNEGHTHHTLASQETFSDSERSLSKETTSLEPDLQVLRKDDMTDVHSDYKSNQTRPCISDEELTESSYGKTQDTDLVYHSDNDIQFTSTDEETVSPLVRIQNADKQVKNHEISCPNNQQFCAQNEVRLTDLQDSASVKDTVIDLQTDVPDTNNEDIDVCRNVEGLSSNDPGFTTDSSSLCIDLHTLKDQNPSTSTVRHYPGADVLTDTNNSPSVLKREHCETAFSVNSDSCDTNTIQPDPSSDLLELKDNAQQRAPSGVFNMLVNTMVDPICGSQERDRSDIIDPFINMIVSHTGVQPRLPDLVVNPNSDIRSDTKLDAPNCKGSEQDSGSDHIGMDTANNNPDIVKQDPIITLSNPSCGISSNATIDLCTVVQSSNNDLERADYDKVSPRYSNAEIDSVDVQLHNNEMRDPLINRTKTNNAKDGTFDLQTHDSFTDSDKPGSAVDKNDSLDSIQFLKDCFPHTEIDLLKSFLNSCNGDLLKTVDSLLEYNKNDYQSVTSMDHDMNEKSTREVPDINSPKHSSVPSADFIASPRNDVPSRHSNTPEENRNSYGTMNVESPIASTPKKFQDISVDSLHLTLDPALALQLLEMFGAFSGVSAKDPLSESARSIRIDKDFAKILYAKWRKTVQAKNKAKKTEESKKFSPVMSDGNTKRKYKTPPRQFYLPDPVQMKPPKSVVSQPEPVSLKEIMDEQLAIHVSQSDLEIDKRFLEEQLDLSTKLKRSRLHGMFPSIDAVALNEIFQANNYDLDTTILQVQSSCGMPLTGKPTTVSPEQSFTNHQSPSNRQSDFQSENSADFQTDVDGNFQSLHDPSYQDYRAEAQTHFELRTECIKKAAIAYSKKQGELAKIYADQARHHGEKIKEANRRAAEKILENRNHDLVHSNTLDLHELHVKEAIQVLDNVLEERRKERRTPNRKSPSYLEVITGRGNRSRYGKPRIKPAVMDYLKRHGYRYEELNSGLYRVFLN